MILGCTPAWIHTYFGTWKDLSTWLLSISLNWCWFKPCCSPNGPHVSVMKIFVCMCVCLCVTYFHSFPLFLLLFLCCIVLVSTPVGFFLRVKFTAGSVHVFESFFIITCFSTITETFKGWWSTTDMAAIATVPNYTPSVWVRLCHAIPRLDLTLQTRDSVFTPDSWEYQQVTLHTCSHLSSPGFSSSQTIFTWHVIEVGTRHTFISVSFYFGTYVYAPSFFPIILYFGSWHELLFVLLSAVYTH